MSDSEKPRNDAERYMNDFDKLMRETQKRAERAQLVGGAERINKAVSDAIAAGMSHDEAWQVIMDNETEESLLLGIQALEAETRRRLSR